MKDWVALADDEYKSLAEEIINGDLILLNGYPTRPYCTFAARGNVACTNGDIEILAHPEDLVSIYREEIIKIKELSTIEVPKHLMRNHLKNLYSGVFSEFNVFLTEIFATLVLGNKDLYEGYIDAFNNKQKDNMEYIHLDDKDCHKKVFKVLHGAFSLNLENRKEEFCNVLKIEFPNYSKIGKHIKDRHNIIHRSGKKIVGTHLEELELSLDSLYKLIDDIDDFICNLMASLEVPITKWHN